MKKLTCVLAILAAASTAVVAKDLKQYKTAPTPTVNATVMSDSEMDKVTAGDGFGVVTATTQTDNVYNAGFGISTAQPPFSSSPGFGNCTAGLSIC